MSLSKLFKDYGLGIVLFVLFATSWLGQGVFQWQEFVQHQVEHKQPVKSSDFISEFLSATFENWQSEFLQLFAMVVLTSKLSFKGSPESKDSEELTEAALARIEAKLGSSKKHAKKIKKPH